MSRPNARLSTAAGALAVSGLIWFSFINAQTFIRLQDTGTLRDETQDDDFTAVIVILLSNGIFAGFPIVILRKSVAPAILWSRLVNRLYDAKVACSWAQRMPAGFSISCLVNGLHLRLDEFAWCFFGVQVSMNLFRGIAGTMATVTGLVLGAVLRTYSAE